MLEKVSLEEAYELPDKADLSHDQAALYIAPLDLDRCLRQIKSITEERIKLSDKHGIEYTIMSLTVPGIQDISDQNRPKRRLKDAMTTPMKRSKITETNWVYLRPYLCMTQSRPVKCLEDVSSNWAFTEH